MQFFQSVQKPHSHCDQSGFHLRVFCCITIGTWPRTYLTSAHRSTNNLGPGRIFLCVFSTTHTASCRARARLTRWASAWQPGISPPWKSNPTLRPSWRLSGLLPICLQCRRSVRKFTETTLKTTASSSRISRCYFRKSQTSKSTT